MNGAACTGGDVIMADREQQTPKPGVEHKPQRGTATRTSGSKGEEQTHRVKDRGSPGRDTADQSKEKNTESAVEAGHKKPGEHRGYEGQPRSPAAGQKPPP